MQDFALAAWAVCFVFLQTAASLLLSGDLCCQGEKSIITRLSVPLYVKPSCSASMSPSLCFFGDLVLIHPGVLSSLHLSNCGVSWVS